MVRFVSLGPSCEVRWQLNRLLGVGPPGDIFDYQITPLPALFAWLERDFEGVFELEDLVIAPPKSADHRALKTEHPHVFHPAGDVLTDAELVKQYPAARLSFERRAARWRAMASSGEKLVFIRREGVNPADRRRLEKLLPGTLVTISDEAAGNPTDWWGCSKTWDVIWDHLSALNRT